MIGHRKEQDKHEPVKTQTIDIINNYGSRKYNKKVNDDLLTLIDQRKQIIKPEFVKYIDNSHY